MASVTWGEYFGNESWFHINEKYLFDTLHSQPPPHHLEEGRKRMKKTKWSTAHILFPIHFRGFWWNLREVQRIHREWSSHQKELKHWHSDTGQLQLPCASQGVHSHICSWSGTQLWITGQFKSRACYLLGGAVLVLKYPVCFQMWVNKLEQYISSYKFSAWRALKI